MSISTANAAAMAAATEPINKPLWFLVCGFLVMFMQAGFAMLEAGCVRDKNVQSVLMKNMIDICVGTLGWLFLGWSFANIGKEDKFGPDQFPVASTIGSVGEEGDREHIFGGQGQFALSDVPLVVKDGNILAATTYWDWFFQWAFCATAATIVSGGVAERVKFSAYLVYVIVMTTIIYPCIVASTWGGGLFNEMKDLDDKGFLDFAGSAIVHLTGGVGALVGAAVLGPRKDSQSIKRFDPEANSNEFKPHSMTLVVLGTLILWFGWYGFNCGSTLDFSSIQAANAAGLVACNTTVAAAGCGCTMFAITSFLGLQEDAKNKEQGAKNKEQVSLFDLGAVCNGVLAGLVSITAGCGNVKPWEAMIIGFIGGIIYFGSDRLLKHPKIGIDDPLNAFPVHGACGMWGVIAAALFDNAKGGAIGPNICLILFIWAWCGGISLIVFAGLNKAGFLYSDPPEGHDKRFFGGFAYNNSPKKDGDGK